MAELKPCPFCGGEPVKPFYYDPYDGYQGNCGSYKIRCERCSATVTEVLKEEAIEAWNRRVNDG